METPCPNCHQILELDDATLASLSGREHFECPVCWSQVPLAGVITIDSDLPAQAALATAGKGINRNLLILGISVIALLGGLAVFMATRKPATDRRIAKSVANESINNKFFSNLVAAGKTTLKDLEAVTDLQPFGAGFLAVSAERLSWADAQALAQRVGGEVLLIDNAGADPEARRRPSAQTERLLARLESVYAARRGNTLWVRDHTGEPRVIDIPNVYPVTTLDRPRPLLIHWRAPRPAPLPPYSLRVLSTDPPLSTDPAKPVILKIGQSVKVNFEYDNPGPNGVFLRVAPHQDSAVESVESDSPSSENRQVGKGTAVGSFNLKGPGQIAAISVEMSDAEQKATVAVVSQPAYAVWEVDSEQWQLELVSVKPPVVLDREKKNLSITAQAGQKFSAQLTARFKTPEPAKLASNFLIKDAQILPAHLISELESNHATTWHFDTESRPGYESVNGSGTITFDLTGYAPPSAGTYGFDLNLGLFDKRSWDSILVHLFKVNLTVPE